LQLVVLSDIIYIFFSIEGCEMSDKKSVRDRVEMLIKTKGSNLGETVRVRVDKKTLDSMDKWVERFNSDGESNLTRSDLTRVAIKRMMDELEDDSKS
jgi:hypothetical protein